MLTSCFAGLKLVAKTTTGNSNPSTDTLSRFAWHAVLLGMPCIQKAKCVLQTVMLVEADMYGLLFPKCDHVMEHAHSDTNIQHTKNWHADKHKMVSVDQFTCTDQETSILHQF